MNDGRVICKKCWATLISEELKNHKKYTPSYKLGGDVVWVRSYDGEGYRNDLPPTAEMRQPKRTPKKRNSSTTIELLNLQVL